MQHKRNPKKPKAQEFKHPTLRDCNDLQKEITALKELGVRRNLLWADYKAGKIDISKMTELYLQASDELLGKKTAPVKPTNKPATRATKPVQLICIEPGIIERIAMDGKMKEHSGDKIPLEYLARYTTTGPVADEWGNILYPINEHDGEEMLAERFVVAKRNPGRKKSNILL
jgi:hypothetical protein